MVTRLSNIPSRISTRRNHRQFFTPLLDPERFIREILNRKTSRRNLEDLGDQSLSDIHHIFVESHVHQSQEMTELFKPLDFSQIAGAPDAIPKDAKEAPNILG